MASKGAKETLVSKLGFKSSSSSSPKMEAELERVRKENAHLRRKMDELAKRHAKPPDSDKSKLLERILSLETLRERNNQQLLVKDQEMETLRQQLSARGGEVVASLQAQLEQRKREAEQRDVQFQGLSEETQNLKSKLTAVSSRCQALESQTQNDQAPPAEMSVIQDQLKDALEKNQQWLMYDQQREAYVQSVLARTMELEQQLSQALQKTRDASSEASATGKSGGPEADVGLGQDNRDQLLQQARKELETQKQQTAQAHQELQAQTAAATRAQAELKLQKEQAAKLLEELLGAQRRCEDRSRELSSVQRRYEEKTRELEETKEALQAERSANRHAVSEERKSSADRADRMKSELESVETRLEDERKRSAELLLQVNLLQKSLLSQNEEQRRMASLEQQIQMSSRDFENEKADRQSMQQQLHKVLKELRKARDQITRLEAAKQPSSRFSEPSSYDKLEFDRLTIGDPLSLTSPSRAGSLLDESFLECPRCRASYPTSQHRELLSHMDYCFA